MNRAILFVWIACGMSAAALGREPWTTSRVMGSPEPPLPYTVERVFPELTFDKPVEMVPLPGSDRLLVAEVEGRIYSFDTRTSPAQPRLFVDLAVHVPGLRHVYGLEFSPTFAEDRQVYICYVLKEPVPDGSRVSRFKVTDADPPTVDLASEEVLITWLAGGHNGGCLKFGQDGYLYISTGDGTGPFPPDIHATGQDTGDLLSSILRIDVRQRAGEQPYSIPPDNPLVDVPGSRPEIWAYGFRNPWKMCVDPATGLLWVGDVGWELWELVYRVTPGGNYGWSIVEGRQSVRPELRRGPTPILPPTVDHPHTEAQSVTGGYVYRGRQLPELAGAYIYGDYVTGKIWGIRHDGQRVTWQQELAQTPLAIICFGEDAAGELYVVDYAGGIHRLVPTPPADSTHPFPRQLSETGLFSSVAQQLPAAGVLPFDVNAAAWHDGATAQRWVAIPGTAQVAVDQTIWQFPANTVLAKTLSLGSAKVETQLLHFDGLSWRGYSYAWNPQQTDAELVPASGQRRSWQLADEAGALATRTWHYPSRTDCIVCHNRRPNYLLAFELSQLHDGEPQLGGMSMLARLHEQQLLTGELPAAQLRQPVLIDPHDATQPLQARARSYLHVNCAHCHRRGGGGNAAFETPITLSLERTALVGTRPVLGDFGITEGQVVAAGDPCSSVLWYRMATLGTGRMPRIGSQAVDTAGLALLHQWIAALESDHADSSSDSSRPSAGHAIDPQLSDTRAALALLAAIDRGEVPPDTVEQLAAAAQQMPPAVRGLFERFVPESQRVERLGTQVDPAAILSVSGDAQRGAALFVEGTVAQCKSCHKVGPIGAVVGPDLVEAAGRRTAAELLDSILDPSRAVDPKFVAWLVETTAGQVHIGLLESRTDREVVLRDAQNRVHRVVVADIVELVPQTKSLMPDGLVRDMTPQQLADLLAWLTSLKSSNPQAGSAGQ